MAFPKAAAAEWVHIRGVSLSLSLSHRPHSRLPSPLWQYRYVGVACGTVCVYVCMYVCGSVFVNVGGWGKVEVLFLCVRISVCMIV